MAIADFHYIAVPVGLVRLRGEFVGIPVSIATNLRFSEKDAASLNAATIRRIVDSHVLIRQSGAISAQVTRVDRAVGGDCKLEPMFGDGPAQLDLLQRYLVGPDALLKEQDGYVVSDARHDDEFDGIAPDRYVNVGALYQRTVSLRNAMLYSAMARVVAGRTSLVAVDLQGVAHERVTRAASLILRFFHEQVFRVGEHPEGEMSWPETAAARFLSEDPFVRYAASRIFASLRSEMGAFRGLIVGSRPPTHPAGLGSPGVDATLTENELMERLARRELNTLVQTAAREPLLARRMGLVSDWMLWMPRAWFSAGVRYLLSLVVPEVATQAERGNENPQPEIATVDVSVPSAFIVEGLLVSPQSRRTGSRNGALLWLNDDDGAHRYTTTQVNADLEIVKTFLLQDSNRVRPPATEAEVGLPETPEAAEATGAVDWRAKRNPDVSDPETENTHGVNQPTTGGVTFHAPVADQINAQTGGTPTVAYHMEDLWVGQRLDVRRVGGDSKDRFLSLHHQNVEYRLSPTASQTGGGRGSEVFVSGATEDYFDREQIVKDKYLDTGFAKWTGLGTAHCQPLMGATSSPSSEIDLTGPLVKCSEQTEGVTPRLLYGESYEYRLRAVFTGGVGLTQEDADRGLETLDVQTAALYRQAFEFYRAEGFSPGEIVDLRGDLGADIRENAGQQNHAVFLSSDDNEKEFVIAPSPLTFDQARFHNLLGGSVDESTKLKDVFLVTDVRRFFSEVKGCRTYFCDPDVNKVKVVAISIGRNPFGGPDTEVVHGTICDAVAHWRVGDGVGIYGDARDYLRFRPIRVRVHARTIKVPRITRSRGPWASCIDVYIPPGDVVDLYFSPSVDSAAAARTAFVNDIKRGLLGDTRYATASGVIAEMPWAALPPVAAQRVLRVIHAVKKPKRPPEIRDLTITRSADESVGHIAGLVKVDAQTSGSAYFTATWADIDDAVNRPAAISIQKTFREAPRNIRFEELSGPDYQEFLQGEVAKILPMNGRQCLENTLVYSIPQKVGGAIGAAARPTDAARVEFKDNRRRLVKLQVRAKSRYRNVFKNGAEEEFETESDPVEVDVPNSGVPPRVQVSHVVPIISGWMDREKRGSGRLNYKFGLRISVDRPWLLTGPDERLAIGCAHEDETGTKDERVRSYTTDWGEDPQARPQLRATTQRPRASDFRAPNANDVGYYDNIVVIPEGTGSRGKTVSGPIVLAVASFRMTYDEQARLWYTSVLIRGEFFGWIKLALYRHQPHSLSGRELSAKPVNVYAAILEGEVITYVEHDRHMRIEIGPTHDRTVSYDVVQVIEDGPGVFSQSASAEDFRKYSRSDSTMYFVNLPKGEHRYLIRRKRAGVVQAVLAAVPRFD